MGQIELFKELEADGHLSVWRYCVRSSDNKVVLLDLILSRSGEELARKPYYPDQPERGWEMTYWPRDPVFRTLPEGAVEIPVCTARTRLLLGANAF